VRRATLLASLAIVAAAVAACGDAPPDLSAQTRIVTTATGSTTASRIDPRTGVFFELETTAGGIGSSLFLRLTKDAPASTRRALSGQVLLFTWRLPHRRVRTFTQRWTPGAPWLSTALLPQGRCGDGARANMATRATMCDLRVSQTGAGDASDFSGPAFSDVRLNS
jgi:hypothetical protein